MRANVRVLVLVAVLAGSGFVTVAPAAEVPDPPTRTAPVGPFSLKIEATSSVIPGEPTRATVLVEAASDAADAMLTISHGPGILVLTPSSIPLVVTKNERPQVEILFRLLEPTDTWLNARLDVRRPGAHFFPDRYLLVYGSRSPATTAVSTRIPWEEPPSEVPPPTKRPFVDPLEGVGRLGIAGTIRVRGRVVFNSVNETGGPTGWVGLNSARVEIWDADSSNEDDLLGAVCTDGDGNFDAPGLDNSDGNAGTVDVYIRVTTPCGSSHIELVNGNRDAYRFENWDSSRSDCKKTTQSNAGSGTLDMGTCDSPRGQDAWWTAFNYAEESVDVLQGLHPSPGGNVRLRIPAGGEGAWYTSDDNTMHISGAEFARTGTNVIVHEHGHFVMEISYPGSTLPPNACGPGGQHFIDGDHTRECAWSEGWPDFWSLRGLVGSVWATGAVYHDPDFTYDFEAAVLDPRLDDNDGHRDDNEAAVAGTLWDLMDSAPDSWDDVDYDTSVLWGVFMDMDDRLRFTGYRDLWYASRSRRNLNHAAFANEIDYDEERSVSSLDSPNSGWMRGSVLVKATASDGDTDVRRVEWYRSTDSTCSSADSFIASDSTAPYSATWNTTGWSNGSGYLCVRAFSLDNGGGAFDRSTSTVGVDNAAASGSVTSPIVAGPLSYSVTWTATDAHSGVDRVQLQEQAASDGTWRNVCSAGGPNGSCTRDPSALDTYCYRAVITDVAGNVGTTEQSCTLNIA